METPVPKNRAKAKLGMKYQAEIPSCKSSSRIRACDYNTRGHLFAHGLEVPVTRIAVDSQSASKNRNLQTNQASCSFMSAVNSSRSADTQEPHVSNTTTVDIHGRGDNGKDVNSCASSSKEAFTWNRDCATTEDGCQGADEEEGQAVSIHPKKRKKKRSSKRNSWQPKRRVSKKPRLEINSAHCLEDEEGEEDSDCNRGFVPGSRPESWSHNEVSSFKLAIFLFGRSFSDISKFIGTKRVSDVSHYYYSKFYGKSAWGRYKAAKDIKSKVAVRGEVILEGWRQAEFLRRLKALVSDDAYREILMATNTFNAPLTETHISSDKYVRRKQEKWKTYVFKLKDVIGLEIFERCVGIGGPLDGHQSKRDLTSGSYPLNHGMMPRQLKEKQAARGVGKSQHTLPVSAGNENHCPLRSEDSMQSTLSVGENWLRRSTSTSKDVAQHFWEQVWPVLMQAGWKIGERKVSIKSLERMMFVRPGVERIHKDDKGISHFDNLNDVLEAVKDDPILSQFAEENMDGSEALDQEEEVRRGWSEDEDMFTTLDGKRTIVPIANASVKPRVTEDSSESSSVDIDLNRTLSAVNSKPHVESAPESEPQVERPKEAQSHSEKKNRFPLGGIDLNLLPVDNECISDTGAEPQVFDRLESEYSDYSSVLKEEEPVPVLVDAAHAETELTLSIGNFFGGRFCAPCPSRISQDCIDQASVQLESIEEEYDPSWSPASSQLGRLINSTSIQLPSRKRPLSFQGCDTGGDWFDNGKELVSLPKKRAITLEMIPRGLGELPVTTYLIRLSDAALAHFCSRLSSPSAAVPEKWFCPKSHVDMGFSLEAFRNFIQDTALLVNLPGISRGEFPFKAFLKALQHAGSYGSTHCTNMIIVPGFHQPRCKDAEDCTLSEEEAAGIADSQQRVSASEVVEDGDVDNADSSLLKKIQHSLSFQSNLSHLLMGSSEGEFQMEIPDPAPSVGSSQRKRSSLMTGSRPPKCRVVDGDTITTVEQERIPEPKVGQHEGIPGCTTKPQCQIKAIRCHFKDPSDRPTLYKERSKRVPRSYSSLVKPKIWSRGDIGDFSSVSESLNSCLTTDSFPIHGRNEEEAPQGAQLRVKHEDSDRLSPGSIRSCGTADQDEEILSEGFEEEKPFRAECKTSREMYSPSAAGDYHESSLYKKPGKISCDTSTAWRRGFQNVYLGVDSEKKRSSGEFDISEGCADSTGKRIKVNGSDMYSADLGVGEECGSKRRHKRSPRKNQIKNVYCKRFLIMLHMDSTEEELPMQNRSSQGPFSIHLPHMREAKRKKLRIRRPSLPCRTKETFTGASPKRLAGFANVPGENEVVIPPVSWPQQDGRFSLRRSLSQDFSFRSGRQCTKRGGDRWRHCCPGC
ncbi:hypothetical protein Mapa_007434 [Marchantia paleacea]|nr:hypothetical protein Mapa_007434 [Marchantia paleacea]